ncbi:MAG: hypothetical protein KKH12_16115 [Gammaproteobacteria bacterium]|nr:hypothetical protein [Gammaproteobacteria bacterium]
MAYRGRLICPFLVSIARIDPDAMHDGDLVDEIFDEPVEGGRREQDPIDIPAQVTGKTFEALNMAGEGDDPNTDMRVVMWFPHLEDLGLVGVDGSVDLRKGDRLVSIKRIDGEAVLTPSADIYIEEAKPGGFALDLVNPRRNLLTVTFRTRPAAQSRR